MNATRAPGTAAGALDWEHLRLDCATARVRVTDREQDRPVGTATLTMGPPWRPGGLVVDADEATWRWSSPDADARLRLTADRTLSARLTITARGADAAVEGPVVGWRGAFACPAWPGGGTGLALLDERPSDGLVVAAVQTRGQVRAAGPGLALTPAGLELAAGRSWVSAWTIDVHPHRAGALAALPAWLPHRLDVAEGEPVRIGLPDAAVSGPGTISTDEEGSLLEAAPGVHRFTVAGPGIDARLRLAWARSVDATATRRARRLVGSEARTAGAAQAMIVAWADARHGLHHDRAVGFLRAWADERLDRPGSPAEALGIVPLLAAAGSDPDRLGAVAERLSALPPAPGPLLAWLGAAPALARAGVAAPPPPLDRDDDLCRMLSAAAAREPDAPPQLWQVLPRLHSGLPWSLDPGRAADAALCCAALGLAPAGWDIGARMPWPLPELVGATRAWLCAAGPDDTTLAWLLWG